MKLSQPVVAFGGPLYEERTEDGIDVRYNWFVGFTNNDIDYVHPHSFRHRHDAEAFATKINDRGEVNLSIWHDVEPRPSLEELWGPFGLEWQIEQDERRLYG